jgi:RING finger and CHY zinc finger domain-containing protein 1
MNKSKQELVKEIQKLNISTEEKMKKIHHLFQQVQVIPEEKNIICSHYDRKCELLSPCCSKWIGCRFCHDEENLCDVKFDRFKVTKIRCKDCCDEQGVSNQCIKCKIEFAKSFCNICNVWTNDNIYHCNDCGFCRVGNSEEYIHCQSCDACFHIGHECVQNLSYELSRDDDCPICFENLFASKKPFSFMNCGHRIHQECLNMQLKNNNYKCPLCKKSIMDMGPVWTRLKNEKNAIDMPDEYRNKKINIVCNDCSQVCETEFHVVGLECHHCGSFNTQRN